MVGDNTSQDKRGRDRIADEGYEAEHIAETTGITRHHAFRPIKRHGWDRETLVREARKLKGSAIQ